MKFYIPVNSRKMLQVFFGFTLVGLHPDFGQVVWVKNWYLAIPCGLLM